MFRCPLISPGAYMSVPTVLKNVSGYWVEEAPSKRVCHNNANSAIYSQKTIPPPRIRPSGILSFICGILGKTKELASNRQSSWFHGDRFDGLWMVQNSQEDSLDAPWHFPRDFSDYHVKNLWSDTLGVRTRFYCFSSQNHFDWKNNRLRDWSYSIVFPVKMVLTGKTIESGLAT